LSWKKVGIYAAGFYLLTVAEGFVIGALNGFLMTTGAVVPPWFPAAAVFGHLTIDAIVFAVIAYSRRLQTLLQACIIVAAVGLFGMVINGIFLRVPVGDSLRDTVWELAVVSIGFVAGQFVGRAMRRGSESETK
jgi:hypothetical protein